jgi:hypothetical protein
MDRKRYLTGTEALQLQGWRVQWAIPAGDRGQRRGGVSVLDRPVSSATARMVGPVCHIGGWSEQIRCRGASDAFSFCCNPPSGPTTGFDVRRIKGSYSNHMLSELAGNMMNGYVLVDILAPLFAFLDVASYVCAARQAASEAFAARVPHVPPTPEECSPAVLRSGDIFVEPEASVEVKLELELEDVDLTLNLVELSDGDDEL